ncbi:unnamed protein product [Tuber aestivum]|uniref:DUF6532 domain-containing protein n=1 Tax=Tuber aestivum TaxID=59557 RepID=A0A292PIG3_9PEZI|nr:unnamed protein product [Tuber aestivum]
MNGNTSRGVFRTLDLIYKLYTVLNRSRAAISRFSRPSASALRSSHSVIDIDLQSQQDEQEGNLFANDDATDIDENSDEAPQRHQRVQKRSVEDHSQHPQRAKRLRFLTADSPSPALSGPTSAFSSQSQQAQIHSGHRRVNSPHFTPSILGSQPILTHPNGRQTAASEEDNLNSASDIVDTVTSLSDRSNFMRGEERIVFENAANMVRYHTWFVNPFVKPSENDSLLESYWVKAASKLGWPGLAMQKHAMTFLKSRQSSARSHLVSETRITVQDFYDLLHKQPAEIRAKVGYLLEDDRFTCHPSKQENCGFRFGAPEIAKLLYHKWFRNVKMRGRSDKSFLSRINDVLICLTAACIYHALKSWSTGTFVQPSDFSALTAQNVYLRQRATWQRLPVVVQKKLVEDTKKRIKRLLRDNGFVQEHESRAALEDPDAAEYLGVQVSGDEESEVEDNNLDLEAEDVIDGLVEGPDEDE